MCRKIVVNINPDNETNMNAGYTPNFFQLAPLNTKDALERIGNPALFKEIAAMLAESVGESIKSLRAQIDADNMKEAMRLAHSLKSNFATVGAEDLYAIAALLETSCRDSRKTEAEEHLSILEAGASQLKEALAGL